MQGQWHMMQMLAKDQKGGRISLEGFARIFG